MVTQELIDELVRRYKTGESKQQITESLYAQGYERVDIEEGIKHIQLTVLMQLPLIPKIANIITRFNTFVSSQSIAMSLGILGGVALLIVIIAIILYAVNGHPAQVSQGPTNAAFLSPGP
jgi:Fe-S cluster assembly scaffold protein SufB